MFEAEVLDETQAHDPNLEAAVDIEGAEFTWDSPPPEGPVSKSNKFSRSKKSRPAEVSKANTDAPFRVKATDLIIPRDKLVAIVGPVGTGKTSLLQGMIGEMRQTAGTVRFGGSVSYCPQSAWIQVSFFITLLQLLYTKHVHRMLQFGITFALVVLLKR